MNHSHDDTEAAARRWRRWFEACADPMVFVDSDLTLLDVNEASERLLLASRDELIGRNYGDFLAAGDVAVLTAAVGRLGELGSAIFHLTFRRSDGSLVPVEAQVVEVGDGTYLGRCLEVGDAIGRDSELTESLRNQELFEGFLRYLPGHAFLKDEEGRYLYANPRLAASRGLEPWEMIGRTDEDFLPPEPAAELKKQDDIVRERGEAVELHRTVGSTADAVHQLAVKFPVGEALGRNIVGGFVIDQTERVRTERELRESERRFRAMMESAQNGIAVADETGRYTHWNASLKALTGYSDQELGNMHVGDLTAPSLRERAVTWREERIAGEDPPSTYETVLLHRSGELIPALLSVTVLYDEERRAVETLLELVDLREQIALREQLAQSQKSEALGTLVAGVAHDFNNLLTAITGSMAMARENPANDEWWARAEQSTERASELVRQLLSFARRDEPMARPVSLGEAIDEATSLARETFDRRIELVASPTEHELYVLMDPGQLQQVLMNLLLNARDAIMERLEVETGESYGGRVSIDIAAPAGASGAPKDGELIALTIADNGAGIPEEAMERIFDPFFTTKEVGQGTGLGLSTVYGILARHDATIEVTSRPGRTAFVLELPACQAPLEEAGDPASSERDSGPLHGSILLVDDEPILREVGQIALERAGFEVTVAEGGNEAIAATRETSFDLIVLDVNMPSPNGWETMLRLHELAPQLRVMIASGDASMVTARERGAVGFLQKPYNGRELIEAVSTSLSAG